MSSSWVVVHVGLGEHTIMYSLLIYWPSGKPQMLTHLPANTILKVKEKLGDEK